jgi:quercetin dioxygenase-like cupin family protein
MPKLSDFVALASLPVEQVTDKISRRIVSGDQVMIVWWSMKAGAHAQAHRHDNEQIAWMLSGKMEFRLGDTRRTCGPGDVVVIPGGVEHEAFFPEDTEVIDVFAPPRADFLAGGVPGYMNKG